MVTAVPPFAVPEVGLIPVTVGAGFEELKVYPPLSVPLWPSVLVTTTSTVPAVCAGVVAVTAVPSSFAIVAVADAPPSFTVAPGRNHAPLMVTNVPPLDAPELGETVVTVGAGWGADPTHWSGKSPSA